MEQAKTFELIYSRQKSSFIAGRAYSNPRFYDGPRQGVTKVLIVGDWPQIKADYEALNVPVEVIGIEEATVAPPTNRIQASAATIAPALSEDERGKVYIPEDWRDLPWSKPVEGRDLTLRGLAALFSAEPVLNRKQAIAAVEAEVARRETAAQEAQGGGEDE